MSQINIPHNDPRIAYSALWTAVPGPLGAEHMTTVEGESLRFSFNVSEGSTIEVHGGVRPTANASVVASSAYTIDSLSSGLVLQVNASAPWISLASGTAPVLRLFESSPLGAGSHTLSVRMLNNHSYYVDFIQINDAAVLLPVAGSSADRPASDSDGKAKNRDIPMAGIVGIVFAILVLLVGIAIFLLLWQRRRVWKKRRQSVQFVEPVRERKARAADTASIIPYSLPRSIQPPPLSPIRSNTPKSRRSLKRQSPSLSRSLLFHRHPRPLLTLHRALQRKFVPGRDTQ